MNTITRYLGGDHKHCDDLFVQAETSVGSGQWESAELQFNQFREALERHLSMEEQVLFPAFEEATGSSAGPTSMMRHEHQQMRQFLQQMQAALESRDASDFLGCSETLNILMQQHNMKEENILYQMTDQVLSGQRDEVIAAMEDIRAAA